MASEDTFEITIVGRGGHAARPHMVIDPLVIGAEIVLALQTIVSRSLDPASSAVVSFVPTVNDPACVTAALAAATAVAGEDRVNGDCEPILASEDFAVFARHVPACFTFIGNGTEPGHGGTPLHSSEYDFNDAILTTGVAYYVELVRSALPTGE